tara:strand:- start:647 stop:835 length:189 start_codon:yes stop_codon:yes gene_type:complete
MYKEKLQLIINLLNSSLDDAIKFDAGNDAAGRRIRKDCQNAKAELQKLRLEIQEERNNRKQK